MKRKLEHITDLFVGFIKTNILPVFFFFGGVLNSILLRYLTIGNIFSPRPLVADIAFVFFITAFIYLFKNKNQFKYIFIISIVLALVCMINSFYYDTYSTFTSISIITYLNQAILYFLNNKINFFNLIFLWFPLSIYIVNKLLTKKYFKETKQQGKSKNILIYSLLTSVFFISIFLLTLSPLDMSKLSKDWSREYVVSKFGIYTYQLNDLTKTLGSKLDEILYKDTALKEMKEYYSNRYSNEKANEYSNIYSGKNVIVIQIENLQTFAMDLSFNGEEVTPNLNDLASSSIFFPNLYTQTREGASSDSEFTFNTSLLPADSGAVFINYDDVEYETIPTLLSAKGYNSVAISASKASFWNRKNMYLNMGYDEFYSEEDFDTENKTSKGLTDQELYSKAIEIIKTQKTPYYMSIISLSNNITPEEEYEVNYAGKEETNEYMEGTKLGDYIKNIHYSDSALGEFIDNLRKENLLNNTVLVIYGSKDDNIPARDYEKLYNFDFNTEETIAETDQSYTDFDYYAYELNKKVPLIIYANGKGSKENSKNIGMYDLMPTIANMFGFDTEYNLGYDIFDSNSNLIAFPNGNFLTDNVYYSSSKKEYKILGEDPIETPYINQTISSVNEMISINNKILKYDLIKTKRITQQIINDYTK